LNIVRATTQLPAVIASDVPLSQRCIFHDARLKRRRSGELVRTSAGRNPKLEYIELPSPAASASWWETRAVVDSVPIFGTSTVP
jgi:hypothetical protein